MQDPRFQWFPVASSEELVARHVYQGQLLGQEFAIWRADDGAVNVWENRCLHRGVRLSIGLNLGSELKCQYHGWRYASGDAACLYIPAHPANAPARTIRNRVYRCVERHGLVWSGIEPEGEPPTLAVSGDAPLTLRPLPVAAPASVVLAALAERAGESPPSSGEVETAALGDFAIRVVNSGTGEGGVIWFVQPTAARACIIRGVFLDAVAAEHRLGVLRAANAALSELRDEIEARGFDEEPPDIGEVEIPLSPRVEAIPGAERGLKGEAIRMRVAKRALVAEDVVTLRLEPISGAPPAPAPGAHIDLHLPNGLVRQYSLTNGPQERGAYEIAVKREPQSKGGSAAAHALREGDLVAVSAPHDNFPVARAARRHLLIAGGIGLTPLLSIARTLRAEGRDVAFHVFARSQTHLPFAAELGAMGAAVRTHLGLDPEETGAALRDLLGAYREGDHVYVCGPSPMLRAAIDIAEGSGWPERAVHFEYFANDLAADDSSSFEVALARSAVTLNIPAGRSITDVLRENGVVIPTSCEQGACGTCLTTVLEGEPDHQDVFLSRAERSSNACMLPCISRAKSARLVLDA
jgi:ferredoxin-NADP reductase/nitrite reductase/ring-hydroxylating ferredoxin subunit